MHRLGVPVGRDPHAVPSLDAVDVGREDAAREYRALIRDGSLAREYLLVLGVRR